MGFDYSAASQPPAFSNPWSSSSPPQPHGTGSSALMMGSHHQQLPAPQQPHPSHHPQSSALSANLLAAKAQPQAPRPTTTAAPSSMTPYGSLPVPTSTDLLNLNRMQTSSAAYPDTTYASSASPVGGQFAPSSAPGYDALGYAPAPVRSAGYSMDADPTRRFSHSSVQDERKGFADALDASHGMLAMSQETPRNIYGGARSDRSSVDSYGFPSTHSTSSSISSSTFSSYYGGGDSVSDYSTAGSDYESVNSRTLPRPQGLMGGATQIPPAPQTMMGQFSSKVSSSTQKKHKCKVCDKRFTRPSSLQTHMYSHTGEKPFACEVEGCGRHFSVVSNLRRHRKVHRGDAVSEVGSEDHHSD
ncbi:hypothetical protein CC79DRAFT_1318591 [Sarocladium strictum]